MPFSNETMTLEDNTTMLKYNNASDEGNEDLFLVGEARFDDHSNEEFDEWHDNSLDDDWFYDSDIPICNNVKGETEHVGGVDVRDVQCDDPIYNNPMASENGIRLLEALLDDSFKEIGNVGISRTWLISGA
ncbi:Uncharacterized protein TCM_028491 [Theobroma cacao]|uniref:Uncharacterized protein n=1 Tax=Theobroma cacao TaxID=3641 RepID=A0A061GAM2_THECC|nr:Uncharacterized protein TCM_028491 [Theobroma cacao]